MVTTTSRSLVERLRSRRGNSEHGSMLLDVLIGMALFAIIALIATSLLVSQRYQAFQSATISDAHNLSTGLIGYVGDNNGATPADYTTLHSMFTGTPLQSSSLSVNLSTSDDIGWYLSDGKDYVYCVIHKSSGGVVDAASLYNSQKGRIIDHETGSHCNTAPASFTVAAALTAVN